MAVDVFDLQSALLHLMGAGKHHVISLGACHGCHGSGVTIGSIQGDISRSGSVSYPSTHCMYYGKTFRSCDHSATPLIITGIICAVRFDLQTDENFAYK